MFYKTWWITDNSAFAIATNYYEETKKRPPPVTAEGAKSRPPRVLSFNTYIQGIDAFYEKQGVLYLRNQKR